jgi:hypothetical protein
MSSSNVSSVVYVWLKIKECGGSVAMIGWLEFAYGTRAGPFGG